MNRSQRIYLDTSIENTDKYIKIRLEQNIDTLEFLSMSLSTSDVYQDFNADYGVLVGRVIANAGIGIPNAKISIFIPLAEEDYTNSDVLSVYPYKTPRDKNNLGKRYNLLPRVGIPDPTTGIIYPKQPFGSFPIKPEIVTNSTFLDVYKKYYKYTAVTNDAGDYMIFGVPIGTQTVHMSVDITDIGKYSMTPAAMVVNLGYSPNLFAENNTIIKPSDNLDDLPNIETHEISVDVIPFWGDAENFEIGITRQDFRIRATLVNTFTVFGSVFTDGDHSRWGTQFNGGDQKDHAAAQFHRISDDAWTNSGIASKRTGKVTETVYYYPPEISDAEITQGAPGLAAKMKILDPSEYTFYKREGDFVLIINCNRDKVVTDTLGNEVPVANDYNGGMFTTFKGYITFEIQPDDLKLQPNGDIRGHTTYPLRMKIKVPQSAGSNSSFNKDDNDANTIRWKNQHMVFRTNTIYSVAKFHGIVFDNRGDLVQSNPLNSSTGFFSCDYKNRLGQDPFWTSGIILTDTNINADENENREKEFPYNGTTDESHVRAFGGNWLNFSLYLPQFNYVTASAAFGDDNIKVSSNLTRNSNSNFYTSNNNQLIGAYMTNTKWYGRSDLHWTSFIEVPKTDILYMNSIASKGLKLSSTTLASLDGKYKNGASGCPYNGGRLNGIPTNAIDPNTYYYKGIEDSNCIEFFVSLGLV